MRLETVPVPCDVLPGDVNQDGVFSLLDVAPFVDLLVSGEYQIEADFNQDGVVSLLMSLHLLICLPADDLTQQTMPFTI